MSRIKNHYHQEINELSDSHRWKMVDKDVFNFTTHNTDEININGTSLKGYINCSFRELTRAFGDPHNSDKYKSDAGWDIEFADGLVATIYNWKDGKNYCGNEGADVFDIIEWNVGGNVKDVVERIRYILKSGAKYETY